MASAEAHCRSVSKYLYITDKKIRIICGENLYFFYCWNLIVMLYECKLAPALENISLKLEKRSLQGPNYYPNLNAFTVLLITCESKQ